MSAPIRFGPYELVRRLGTGGMAETYLGIRRGPAGFEQEVCVKRILPAYESDPELVGQFLEEARLAAQLRHANIVQVVDFGEVGGSPYLALELVDGMDLRTLIRRLRERQTPLDPAFAVLLGLELASALELAHGPGRNRPPVIHRDVSPSNVLLSRAGEIYLTDFGIARALGVERRTDSGVVRGKVPYMAAEYAMHRRFDARSDLFSVGVVLYEALAGRRPYEGVTDLDTLTKIQRGEHAPLASLRPDAPAPLVTVIERLLRPHPEERLQSAAALMEALAVVSPPPTVARQLGELVREHSPSLSHSLRLSASGRSASGLSAPSPTAVLGHAPPPSYPQVAEARPDEATRTSEAVGAPVAPSTGTAGLWSATGPNRPSSPGGAPPWKATDPTQISQHDRPSPYVEPSASPSSSPSAFAATAPASDPPPAAPSPSNHLPQRTAPLAATRPMNEVVSPGMPALSLGDAVAPASAKKPAKNERRGCLWAALVTFGVVAFVAASAGAYALVHAWRIGAL